MGVIREAGGVGGLLFQRGMWGMVVSRFGHVGARGLIWLGKRDGGEGERGSGG
jgi:hypothetical protein